MPDRQLSFALGTVAAVTVLALALRASVNRPDAVYAGTPQLCCLAGADPESRPGDHRPPMIRVHLPIPLVAGRELRVTVEGQDVAVEIKRTGA